MSEYLKEPAGELQAVLNHLAGPMPGTELHNVYSDEFLKKFNRATWFNSCLYGQTKTGTWSLLYASTEYRMQVVKADKVQAGVNV
jgi:hypothetical protein